MTKQEFFATLMNNQVMPLATIDVMHEGRSMYSLYVRQRNAPNCTLSRHCDGSKTGQDMHGKYLDWMHEYAVKFDELVDAAHAEALAINETLDIIANDQAEAAAVVNAVDTDIAVGIAHAEALEENKRFDNLLARFVQFKRWYPSVQRSLVAVAHADALELDKAYDEALEQEADLRRYFLKQSRPNSGIRADSETMKRAIVYAHEEALEMDKARGVPPFPGVKAASIPPMPPMPPMPGIKSLPVAVSADAAVYLSAALQIGDRIEVLYGKGQSEEIRRVYELVSLPVRVANTCYQIFLAKQIGDHRVHRIAFNATIDGWELFGRKEDN